MGAFADLKVDELKKLAKVAEIKGADGMKKAELIEALEKHRVESGAPMEEIDPVSQVETSSPEKSDYASHPKFAKFISKGSPE
jgi:hypothetical protein